jgi:nucleotide-binding universal stress UspA family protein
MFEHILVPLDGSPLAESVLPHTVALAQTFGARVTLLQAVERGRATGLNRAIDPLNWHIRKAEAEAYLDEVAARLQAVDLRTDKVLLEGLAAERIIEFAHEQDVSLILLSSHGQSGLSEWNINSVVQKVILRAYMPVLIVRAYQPAISDLTGLRYRRLLVPLDGSQRAECALPLASTLARFYDSQLLLAHVVSRPEVPRRAPLTQEEIELVDRLTELNRREAVKYLEDLRSRLLSDAQIRLLISEDAAAALHELVVQENVDLVLLSAHGYTGEAKWPYGSVALNFIAYGTTPLLIMQDLPKEELERTQAEISAREHKGH